jgi:hypothetical protein
MKKFKDLLVASLPMLCVPILALLIFWVFYSFGYLLPTHWKIRYVAMYHVSANEVLVQDKPKLCDWGHAPIGDKGCHYEAVVNITRWSKSTEGKPIVSHDNGKKWHLIQPDESAADDTPKLPSALVIVTWEKMEDN